MTETTLSQEELQLIATNTKLETFTITVGFYSTQITAREGDNLLKIFDQLPHFVVRPHIDAVKAQVQEQVNAEFGRQQKLYLDARESLATREAAEKVAAAPSVGASPAGLYDAPPPPQPLRAVNGRKPG